MRVRHPAWFEIDLAQFCCNLAIIRQKIGRRLFCCVVKANAYGHGMVPMAKAAEASGQIDLFAVAHGIEGVKLRKNGIRLPILVLGAIHEDQIEDMIRYSLEFSISSSYKADLVAKKAEELGATCPVHVEIDTGMRRTGVRVESAPALIDKILARNCFTLKGVYSHFAMSETAENEMTLRQIEQFYRLKEQISHQGLTWHLANSGGVSFYPDSWLDMVRPGLLCYGLSPWIEGLEPILTLKAKVSFFKVVAASEGISYGHTYRTQKQARVITIPVGYGDGYRRDFSNRMRILLREKSYAIAGSVCMDQFMVDIGDDEAYVGDVAVLLGRQGKESISLQEMAEVANTDPREILCHFNERIPRIYRSVPSKEEALFGF